MIPSLAFGSRDNQLIMQDITDDDETEYAYIPTDEADSILYYDQETSMTHMEDTNTSANTEENNNIPHSDMPTDMIQLNDSVTVSTVTNDVTTPAGTENNQVTSLSDIAEKDNQNETIQNLDDNMEIPMNTSYDESNQNDEQQNIAQAPVESIVDTTLDDEMNATYGSRTTNGTYGNESNEHMTTNTTSMPKYMLLNCRKLHWLHHKCQSIVVSSCSGQKGSVQLKWNCNNCMISR